MAITENTKHGKYRYILGFHVDITFNCNQSTNRYWACTYLEDMKTDASIKIKAYKDV